MASLGSQAGKRGSGSGGRAPKARSYADEALNNALAKGEDTTAALEAKDLLAHQEVFLLPPLPAALLERRYNKEKNGKGEHNQREGIVSETIGWHEGPVGADKGTRCSNCTIPNHQ